MDFTLICSNIQELLIGNEPVVIPQVGELRVEMEPAAFLQDGKTILPPKKKLVFEQSETGAESQEWLQDLGKKIRESLVAEGEFEVPGLGIFTDKGEGKIEFSLNEEFDFAPDSFSLEAISLETADQPHEKESEPELEKEEVPAEKSAENQAEMYAEKPSGKSGDESIEKSVEESVVEAAEKPAEEPTVKPAEEPAEKPAGVVNVGKEECDVEHRKDCRRKWMMVILIVLVLMAVIALFVLLFKEDIIQALKGLLYTEEELEIMKKWAAQ